MRKLCVLLLSLIVPSVFGQAIAYVPPASALFYSSDGTGNPGTWTPASGGGSGAISYVPPSAAMYCSSDGTGNKGTWVPCNPTGGGGGNLPTAAFSGQIITSTGAGTNYLVQGQVFYSRSGDTISSIETECSSLCTYIVTIPQTITLAANHTLNSNVQLQFMAGGKWTVNGAFTLTIPGLVTGTLNPHFAGTSTLSLGSLNGLVPVEWFGAVGDWNGSSGTDNTTAIQACFNAIQAGQCQLQAALYEITAALTISSKSRVGLIGSTPGANYAGTTVPPNPSGLITTSASADLIDVAGVAGVSYDYNNVFQNFALERSVAPTLTATGLSLNSTWGVVIDNVQVMDSVRGFYAHASLAAGVGRISNCAVTWGFGTVGGYTGTQLTGYYLDSADGIAENSFRARHIIASSDLSTAVNTVGFFISGKAINDVMVYGLETATVNYGIYVTNTGGGSPLSSADIHFYGSILDQSTTSAIFVNQASASTDGGVEFNGGYALGQATTGANFVDIESSSGVSISNMELGPVSSSVTNAVYLNNVSQSVVSGNRIKGVKVNGVTLNGSSNNLNVVTSNSIVGSGATGALINSTNSSTQNTIGDNSLAGTAAKGISFDASSGFANSIETNTIQSTITTATFVPTPTNVPLSISQLTQFYAIAGPPAIVIAQPGAASYSQMGFGGSLATPVWQYGVGNASETGLGVANKMYLYNVGSTSVAYAVDASNNFAIGYSGVLPGSFSKKFQVGTTGQFNVDTSGNTVAPSVKTTTYTVAGLPSAATLGAGAQVVVSDATTFTPGTCTGGGSDYMIAVSNGTTWSCH